MKDINLIPPDVVETRHRQTRLRAWITADAVIFVIVALSLALSAWSVQMEKRTAGRIDSQVAELQGLTLQLEQFRSERSALAKEEQALGSLMNRTPDRDLVHAAALAIADYGWLSRMELSRSVGETREIEKDGGRLILQGQAGSYNHLACLMSRLDHLDYIAGVDLKRSQRGQADGIDVIQFDLECSLVPGT
jgi:Tfp pilus assembly protein PilN